MASKLKNKFLTQSISKLYLNEEYADVNFVFPAENVPANKIILAVASSVFNAMFFGPMKEGKTVKIVDTSASSFKEFLQFFYLNEVTLTIENIEHVARLADKYDMLVCINMCADFLQTHLTADNMFWGYQLAVSLENKKLKAFFERRICISPLNMFKSNAFLRCKRAVLKSILLMDSMFCTEIDIFDACLGWAKTACRKNKLNEKCDMNLKSQLDECFYLIRFGTIQPEKFAKLISNKLIRDLFTRDELADVFCTGSVNNFRSTYFNQNPRKNEFQVIWHQIDKIVCDREEQIESSKQQPICINANINSTFFSTSSHVLLGELHCVPIKDRFNGGIFGKFTVNIFEQNAPLTNLITEELIYQENNQSGIIVLSQSLIIKPDTRYEIRFNNNHSGSSFYHYTKLKSSVKMNDELTVTFYNEMDPNIRNSNRRNNSGGLISQLYFAKI